MQVRTKKRLAVLLTLAMAISLFAALPLTVGAADKTAAETAAESLRSLGLFRGTSSDPNDPQFELDRIPTRAEGIVMLIRLMGVEAEALSGEYPCPFEDVPAWAADYVGYAYAMGWTKGVSEEPALFDPNSSMTATQYLTFVLRALDYVDGVDFTWNAAWQLSDTLGITNGEFDEGHNNFFRGDMAVVSLFALTKNMKGTSQSLISSLIKAGVFEALAEQGLITDEAILAALAAEDEAALEKAITDAIKEAVDEVAALAEEEKAAEASPSASPSTPPGDIPLGGGGTATPTSIFIASASSLSNSTATDTSLFNTVASGNKATLTSVLASASGTSSVDRKVTWSMGATTASTTSLSTSVAGVTFKIIPSQASGSVNSHYPGNYQLVIDATAATATGSITFTVTSDKDSSVNTPINISIT
ncbi:MAG: hypothetical protein FWG32_04685 [Oscillospiraceae bacterium]|nr:hypothetical protein [Oscillospiraceae bacterium]